jgi:hypothetical protein
MAEPQPMVEVLPDVVDELADRRKEASFLSKASEKERKEASSRPERLRPAEFDALVQPLERIGDSHGPKRLNGPGLDACLEAFRDRREEFEQCIERVLGELERDNCRSPVGLLCYLALELLKSPAIDVAGCEQCGRALTKEDLTRTSIYVDDREFFCRPCRERSGCRECGAIIGVLDGLCRGCTQPEPPKEATEDHPASPLDQLRDVMKTALDAPRERREFSVCSVCGQRRGGVGEIRHGEYVCQGCCGAAS